MRRHRLLPITLVSFLLLCLTVICANASWFIQDKSEKDGSASNIAPDTSDYFTTGGHVFDAGKTDATPALNSDGVTVLGGTTADYTITWVGCALNTIDSQTKKPIEIWKETASGDTSTLEGVVAGTHYYQIVENATGQIISNRHAVTIQKRPVTVSTPAAKAGFVGMNSTWDYSVYGISSNGGTYAFDGSNVSFQYSYTPTLQDYYKTGYKTSTTAHTKDSTFPASEDVTYTGKVIDKYPSLSGSTQYGNFTVDYANNYYIPADLTYTATCNVLPTTYTTQNTTTYWATLTEAIKNTTSGTIYPMQQVNGYSVKTTAATPKGTYYEHLITENCEIKPGVTLTLLYGTDPATILTYTNGTISELVYTARNSTHLKNEVTICADIKLTNYGSIVIAGTVHGGNGGSRVNSAVGGSHAQIKMMDRAGLICKTAPNASTGGDLTCYGFITEASNKNQSYVDVINGNTTVVFSMSEHRGGTHFFEIYSGGMKGTPFNRFWIETISSRLTVHHGAYLLGHVMLYANSQNNPSDIALIGNSNRYLIQTKDGTQITAKYNHDYNGVTVTNRTTELEIKGDADFNSMAISIDTGIPLVGVVSLSTSTVFFPLSGYYHVTLSPNEDKKGNPIPSTVVLNTDLKLLPGAKLEIKKNVTLTGKQMVVYDSMHGWEATDTTGATYKDPPASVTYQWGASTPANLIVSGKLEMQAFGGLISAASYGAVVDIQSASATSNEIVTGTNWESKTYTLTLKKYADGKVDSTATANLSAGKYYSIADKDNSSTFGFLGAGASFKLSYSFVDANGNALSGATHTNPTTYTLGDTTVTNLTDATLSEYSFAGWFFGLNDEDGSLNENTQSTKLDPDAIFMQCGGDAVIYGRFAPTSYTVSFDSGDSNHSGSNLTVGAINSMSVAAGTWFNPYAIAELDSYVSGYEYDYLIDRSFIGWYNGDTLIDQNTGILVNGNLTLTAKWEKKCRVEFSVNKGTATAYKGSNVIYVVPGKTLNPYGFFSTGIYDSDIGFQYYFGGSWCTDNSFSTAYERTDILIEKDTVFYSDWLLKTKIILSFDGATPTWTGCTSPELEATEMYLIPGTEITVSVTYSGDNNQTFSVTPNNVVTSQSGNSKSIKVGTETITISASSSCIAAGTLITLADGTQKKVEDLLETDILLVFDHETGTYVECPILFIERDGWAEYNIINLTFSNGTTARLIYEHALFDLTLNRYVYITEQNYSEFVGHEFAVMDENGYQTVTLTEAYITTEYTGCYSLVTVYHFNYFIDGLFSMPGGIEGLFNFFEYDESLKYDEEKMAEDIEKYGLYTYEDFAPYMPEEVYQCFQAPYYKVAVEKGMITFEEIVGLIEKYLVQHGIV